MNILITGANGYLGSNLVSTFCEYHDVISLVRKSSNLARIGELDTSIKFVDELDAAFYEKNVDVVVNTAALYGRNHEDISELIDANIMFPQKLFEKAKRSGVKLFINIGTSLPSDVSIYAKTKNVLSELLASQQNKQMKIADLNLEHFYGFGDDKTKFTTYIFESCFNGLNLDLTEGTQRRDFVHVDDVAAAVKVVFDNMNSLGACEKIDVGSGEAPTVRYFVETVKDIFGSNSALNFGAKPSRLNEVQHSQADITRLKELGWKKRYDLVNGVKNVLDEFNLA